MWSMRIFQKLYITPRWQKRWALLKLCWFFILNAIYNSRRHCMKYQGLFYNSVIIIDVYLYMLIEYRYRFCTKVRLQTLFYIRAKTVPLWKYLNFIILHKDSSTFICFNSENIPYCTTCSISFCCPTARTIEQAVFKCHDVFWCKRILAPK